MEAVQAILYVKKYSMGYARGPPAPLMPVAFKQLGDPVHLPQTTSSTVRLGLWWKSEESCQQCLQVSYMFDVYRLYTRYLVVQVAEDLNNTQYNKRT